MPSETFFNLNKEKQQRILAAAQVEFSRASLQDASISNVIKAAGIPRGSFYQYFEDKEDLYFYYFHTLRMDSHRNLIESIKEVDGDLFKGIEVYFDKMLPEIFEDEHASFYHHMMINMDFRRFRKVTPQFSRHPDREHARRRGQEELYEVIDKSSLEIDSVEEMQMLFGMIMHMLFSTIAGGYQDAVSTELTDVTKIKKQFERKLSWIKEGAQKKGSK